MSDLNDVVNQLAALRGVLTQMNPQAPPAWGAPAPSTAMVPAFPATPTFNPGALHALQQLLAQPDTTPTPAAVVAPVDEELRREVKNLSAQVQALATAMQMMASQMAALVSTTRARLETLAAASMTLATTKPDATPREVLSVLDQPPQV